MAKDKIFCGNGKVKTFSNGGKLINAFLNVDVLSQNYKAYGFMSNRDERTIKLKICPVKDKPGDYYLEIDTWKPANPAESNPTPHPQAQQAPPIQQQQGQGPQGAPPSIPPPQSQDQINNAQAYDYDMPPHPQANENMPPQPGQVPQPQQAGPVHPNAGPDDIPF